MRRLFFFTEFYYPVQNTTGYYLTRIIHAAARCLAIPVVVYCAVPSAKGELRVSPNLSVHRIRECRYDKKRIVQRVLKYVIIAWRFAVCAAFHVRPDDMVFAVTNPAFAVVLLALLRKIKSFKYTLLVYDVFPENLVAADLARKKSILYRLAVACFNWAYRAADDVIVIGRDMEEVVRAKMGGRGHIVRIPNWADVKAVTPAAKSENPLIQAHHLEDKIVFLFAGNLGRVQGIENLLNGIRQTRSRSAAFVFVGDGVFGPEIRRFIEENPDRSVTYLGYLPMSEQQVFLNACDVALVTLDDAMYGLGVPSKSYFNMAAGKPLLLVADADSEIGRVIHENAIGWIVPPDEPEMLARTIDEVCNTGNLDELGRRAREVAERQYSEQVVLSRYERYFCELAGQTMERECPVNTVVDAT